MTFVSVVEAGAIEVKAIRLAESLRQWGGRFAGCPILFVKPRSGPALSAATLRRMRELDIDYLQKCQRHQYDWYHFLNKPIAIRTAAEKTQTPYLCWLDDDILVLDEPVQLMPASSCDFVACAPDLNLGTQGPGDRFHAYWDAFCTAVGTSLEAQEFVHVHRENIRTQSYFNSGVFAFRLTSGFIDGYLATVLAAMDARITSSTEGIYMHEQMSCGIAARKINLNVGELPWTYNFNVSDLKDPVHQSTAERVVLLHYHSAFFAEEYQSLCQSIGRTRPDRLDFVRSLGPLEMNYLSTLTRLRCRLLRSSRERKRARYISACRSIDTSPALESSF
jgi:hypothetical protein